MTCQSSLTAITASADAADRPASQAVSVPVAATVIGNPAIPSCGKLWVVQRICVGDDYEHPS